MISTDRMKKKAPDGALQAVRDFYESLDDIPESYGTVIQYWSDRYTHLFVVMIDGRCDGLRVWKGTSHGLEDSKWNLSVDSQTEFIEEDPV